MPEILKEGGLYADPERPDSLAAAMNQLMRDESTRTRVAAAARGLARQYSWTRCASDTFQFLAGTRRTTGAPVATRTDEHRT
jgi:glycosyltransferase involved in cell wall biosynthesis